VSAPPPPTALSKPLRKYLTTWAEPETRLAADVPGPYENVLVIPVLREQASFLDGVRPAVEGAPGATLVIVVVNAAEDASAEAHSTNAEMIERLRHAGRVTREWPDAGASFLGSGAGADLLVIDRASEGRRLPAGEGVGRARKIGSDVALSLRVAGRLASEWIHASDADAVQPPDRFAAAEAAGAPGVVAVTHPFRHTPSGDDALDDALRRYEHSLRYWVQGLEWAGSPYAFHAVGSTLAVRAEDYARVRGFPDREAGEDFYLLNKLAKLGRVAAAGGAPVQIRGRLSDRVPFGTGRAIRRILDDDARGEPFRLYHPVCFRLLKRWLVAAEKWAREGEDAIECATRDLPIAEAGALAEALDAAGARRHLAAIHEHHGRGDLLRPFHTWFDGFRTLKLVHAIRDRGYAGLKWREALESAPFVTAEASKAPPPAGAQRA
jgi:hypothetical protein